MKACTHLIFYIPILYFLCTFILSAEAGGGGEGSSLNWVKRSYTVNAPNPFGEFQVVFGESSGRSVSFIKFRFNGEEYDVPESKILNLNYVEEPGIFADLEKTYASGDVKK